MAGYRLHLPGLLATGASTVCRSTCPLGSRWRAMLASDRLTQAREHYVRGISELADRQAAAACCSFSSVCHLLTGHHVHQRAVVLHSAALVRVCECKLRLRELASAATLATYLLACRAYLQDTVSHQLLLIRGLAYLGVGKVHNAVADLETALHLAPPERQASLAVCLQLVRAKVAAVQVFREFDPLQELYCVALSKQLAPGALQRGLASKPAVAARLSSRDEARTSEGLVDGQVGHAREVSEAFRLDVLSSVVSCDLDGCSGLKRAHLAGTPAASVAESCCSSALHEEQHEEQLSSERQPSCETASPPDKTSKSAAQSQVRALSARKCAKTTGLLASGVSGTAASLQHAPKRRALVANDEIGQPAPKRTRTL